MTQLLRSPRLFVPLLLIGVIFGAGVKSSLAAPHPKEKSEVDKLLEEGVKHREKGEDAQALELFQRAYEKSHEPRALAQIALAEVALGRWVEAEKHLNAALAESDNAYIRSHKQPLLGAQKMIDERLGDLEVMGNVKGASVFIDGKLQGTLPLEKPLRIVAGTVTLDVSADGYRPISRPVTIPARGLVRETVELGAIPLPKPQAAAAPPPGPAPSAKPAPSSGTPTHLMTAAEPEGSPLHTLAWVSAGAAVASLAVGIVGWRIHESHAKAYNDLPACPSADPRCADEESGANTGKTITTIGLVGAGVFGAAAVAMFLLAPEEGHGVTASIAHPGSAVASIGHPGSAAAWTASCAPGILGVTCGLTLP